MTAEQEAFIRSFSPEKAREKSKLLVALLQRNGYADHPLVVAAAAELEPRAEEHPPAPSVSQSLP